MTRVLIADDHPLMLAGIAGLLEGTDYEIVAQVPDGTEVLDACHNSAPDIALLDVNMPGMSGLEVLRVLAQRDTAPRVVLLTAELRDEELLEALDLNVAGIVLKNGGERLLIDCLDKVAAGGRFIAQEFLVRETALKRERESDPLATLTQRERDLADGVARGLRNRAIASELGLTEGSVKVYLNRVYEKLGISSRTELALAMAARRHGESGRG